MERKARWVRTLLAQLAICLALFFTLHMGRSQKKIPFTRVSDLYFITVRGGFRPLHPQTRLLNQMEKVARKYKARFVVNVGEHGDDDPLMQNATRVFPSLKVPWYSTGASKAHENGGYFFKKLNVSDGNTLDIIGLNTGLLQPSDEMRRDQLLWLQSILKSATGNWRIIFGFHSLIDKKMKTSQLFKTLKPTFMEFEVDAFISGQYFIRQASVSDVRNPSANVTEEPDFIRKMDDGFLLHRVSSLEIAAYFVTPDGQVVHKNVVQHKGRAVM